jgi:hypothetical protein
MYVQFVDDYDNRVKSNFFVDLTMAYATGITGCIHIYS